MKTMTVEEVENVFRTQCMVAPITISKIIKVFQNDNQIMHVVLNMFHEGKFVNYHMLPGNGHLEF